MTDAIENQILHALFCLSRDTRPIDAGALGRAVGVSTVRAAAALVALEQAGLVDASRARLTMVGLARAVAIDAGSGGRQPDLVAAATKPAPRPLPVAAAPAATPGGEEPDSPQRPVDPEREGPRGRTRALH